MCREAPLQVYNCAVRLLEKPCPSVCHDLLERLAEADSFAQRPGNFADSPEDRMDAFSEILSGVKLNGAVFFSAEFSAPWGFSAPASNIMAAMLGLGRRTSCFTISSSRAEPSSRLADGQSIELKPGDVVIFPHGDPHHMSSGAGRPGHSPTTGLPPKSKRAT